MSSFSLTSLDAREFYRLSLADLAIVPFSQRNVIVVGDSFLSGILDGILKTGFATYLKPEARDVNSFMTWAIRMAPDSLIVSEVFYATAKAAVDYAASNGFEVFVVTDL